MERDIPAMRQANPVLRFTVTSGGLQVSHLKNVLLKIFSGGVERKGSCKLGLWRAEEKANDPGHGVATCC